MRVIAGRFRGRPLVAPAGRTTRPITDRVKESLFSILGSRLGTLADLPDVNVLDLFAGSGALGIEALSRGAATCVFLERDFSALRALRENLAALKLAPPIVRIDAANAWSLRRPAVPGDATAGFGLVFCDPPYKDAQDAPRIGDWLDGMAAWLTSDGLLVLRLPIEAAAAAVLPRCLTRLDERVFGSMCVLLYGALNQGSGPEVASY
jgi:16S rRNA (guanine966-N2)-methyltransferase